MKGRILLRCSG